MFGGCIGFAETVVIARKSRLSVDSRLWICKLFRIFVPEYLRLGACANREQGAMTVKD